MNEEQFLSILESRSFEDFYNNELEDFITGEEGAMTRTEILAKIKSKFFKTK